MNGCDRLYIEEGEALLQVDGSVYKLPAGASLSGMPDIGPDTAQMAVRRLWEYASGSPPPERENWCKSCHHKIRQRLKGDGAGRGNSCHYAGDTDFVMVYRGARSLFQPFGRKFMAKQPPCSLSDALHRALVGACHLDEYLLQDVEPASFHVITSISPGSPLEDHEVERYNNME